MTDPWILAEEAAKLLAAQHPDLAVEVIGAQWNAETEGATGATFWLRARPVDKQSLTESSPAEASG